MLREKSLTSGDPESCGPRQQAWANSLVRPFTLGLWQRIDPKCK
jgi:hypothetical protein